MQLCTCGTQHFYVRHLFEEVGGCHRVLYYEVDQTQLLIAQHPRFAHSKWRTLKHDVVQQVDVEQLMQEEADAGLDVGFVRHDKVGIMVASWRRIDETVAHITRLQEEAAQLEVELG